MNGHVIARCLVGVLVTSILLPVETSAQAQTDPSAHAAQEDSIREMVLRYQMEGWANDGDKNEREAKNQQEWNIARQLNSRVYFLSVNGKDPNEEFLKRFQDFPRIIKKASQCMQTKKFSGWVVDKKTKQPGIVFRADEIRWIKEGEVEVDGGYHCGGLCGAGDVFTVHFENGRWKVVASRMKWIS